jgi:hypothetical protein
MGLQKCMYFEVLLLCAPVASEELVSLRMINAGAV